MSKSLHPSHPTWNFCRNKGQDRSFYVLKQGQKIKVKIKKNTRVVILAIWGLQILHLKIWGLDLRVQSGKREPRIEA